jgi:tagaturonate epimerase
MEEIMELEKYSMGIGDRFGPECTAQLRALQKAAADGLRIAPVWNKSHREHMLARTMPEDARKAADEAVRACGWKDSYYVDADHIGRAIVDSFIPFSNFFTIEMADFIGKPASSQATAAFLSEMSKYKGSLAISGIPTHLEITDSVLADFAKNYLFAIEEAGAVYRRIAEKKGPDGFVTEVSCDEAQSAQTPVELFLILAAASREGIPVQTIAPKFTGAFLKGVDYVGDSQQFAREFREDLAIIAFAVSIFNLPRNLKLSIHTGSDKFTLYPLMHHSITEMNTGIHLKTAGTTWLEELAGIAGCGGAGLELGKEIYRNSFERYDELCAPYLAVIRIDKNQLPSPERVASWSSEEFLHAMRHNRSCPEYNSNLRQLLHLGFKVAAEMPDFYKMLGECRSTIEENVTRNIYERHIRPLFLGLEASA